MNDLPPPDTFQKRLHFGCGLLLGGFVGLFVVGRFAASYAGFPGLAVAIIAILFAMAAWRYGEPFWHGMLRVLRAWMH